MPVQHISTLIENKILKKKKFSRWKEEGLLAGKIKLKGINLSRQHDKLKPFNYWYVNEWKLLFKKTISVAWFAFNTQIIPTM